MNSLEIKTQISEYVEECRSIVDLCKTELRHLTENEQNRFDELKGLIEERKQDLITIQNDLENVEIPNEEIRNIQNNKKMEKNYSLIKNIRSIVNGDQLDALTAAVNSAGKEEFRNAGISFSGQIQLPSLENRATVTVTAEGEDIVATDVLDVIGPLRQRNVLVQAGAKYITGLVGDVKIPVMSATNVTWEGETASAKDGAGAFTHVKLSPKRLTAYIDLSKQFILQDGCGAEQMLRNDLIAAINAKLESTILGEAAGTSTQPAGMFNGVEKTAITSFDKITSLEATVEGAGAYGENVYIVSPTAKAALRNMPKSAKTTQLVMENGEIDGTSVLTTGHVGAGDLVYGDFTNLAIGVWSGVDLTVDPYTKAGDGIVRLVVNFYADAAKLRNNTFAYGTVNSGE
jgi:HK97 family phage major capsid protein